MKTFSDGPVSHIPAIRGCLIWRPASNIYLTLYKARRRIELQIAVKNTNPFLLLSLSLTSPRSGDITCNGSPPSPTTLVRCLSSSPLLSPLRPVTTSAHGAHLSNSFPEGDSRDATQAFPPPIWRLRMMRTPLLTRTGDYTPLLLPRPDRATLRPFGGGASRDKPVVVSWG